MSQSDKAAYFQALKASGVKFEKHYRDYSTQELAEAYTKLKQNETLADLVKGADEEGLIPPDPENGPIEDVLPPPAPPAPSVLPPPISQNVPAAPRDESELPGQRQNTKPEDEPIRVDELGRVWLQEEVRKPAYPKPRGRRVLKYMESGVNTETVQNGEYVETFEVAGDGPKQSAEVKITLPSYQVGIFRDPRFPFKVHTYGGKEGFDLFEVQNYYGGSEMVPAEVKRTYVENVLCYDIRTVVRAIQTEYRQQQLAGRIQ